MNTIHIFVAAPRCRPDFRVIIAFLWGDNENVDTDGDSFNPASRDWTELYIANRNNGEIVDINPSQKSPLILDVQSDKVYLAARVAYFLAVSMGSKILMPPDKDFRSLDILIPLLGNFDLDAALKRAGSSPFLNSSLENPYPSHR
ncbi:MAG TPA: hypothetical protein VKX17_22010 [Planctomycetota bacterium]|nr:hypothetical protein [Planctomycetota bacterium]